MARKLYPIGMQTFEEIRNRDYLYIDKTEYVYRMTHTSGKYFFLSRPRRFGKSLLVSTLRSYFEGKKELFEGLAIEKLEKEWESYPVLHFSMAGGMHMEKEDLELYLNCQLGTYEKKYGIIEHRISTNIRLSFLINHIYDQIGKQVVILVDDWDAPLLDVASEKKCFDEIRNVMLNFYSSLKDCDSMLRFVFLTGITKSFLFNSFRELNHVIDISMDVPYAGICGITEEELLTQMSEDIDSLAQHLELSREETIERLKSNYDGYHFTWPSPDVYNPFSLLNCFADGKLKAYWFGLGTPTYLINMMRRFNMKPSDFKAIQAKDSAFDAPTETMTSITPLPLLYQCGYITIKDYDKEIDLYTLDVPNKEIKTGLLKCGFELCC